MRLYAERLGSALARNGTAVLRIRPQPLVADEWRRRSWWLRKMDDYLGRHLVHPRLVYRLPTDIVHLADHSQGYLINYLDRQRTVVTCHDLILLALVAGRIGEFPVPQVALQIFRVSLELTKQAAAVIADSSHTKRDLVELVGVDPGKVRVIFPGLNQTFTPNAERGALLRRRFALGDGPLVLQLGRNFYKNISGVIRVVHRLRQQGVPARLVRAGRRLEGAEAALADALGMTAFIHELGAIDDADMPALYNAVDLLLFPSLYEGFGWPPLEAMASGTPVVASRAGSLDEILGDAAFTAEPTDVESLATLAARALTDAGMRRAAIARGLAHAARFSWDRAAEAVRQVYDEVAARAA